MLMLGFLGEKHFKTNAFQPIVRLRRASVILSQALKRRNMDKESSKENCYSEQIGERDASEVQPDPETNKKKMRLGTHRYRNFQNSPRSGRVPATIGWRRRFFQLVSNVVRRFRNQRRH
ncbi:hypothetical protein CDAR_477151 [Caerostris darwini]|uniref:Uncharacterized protein n=1 Tax=Caerostris darwini TaxID=1538125 RepID=A0AAV4TCI2_9ARAC|nr:hypothetical protein CDAR_477151 [Caerostris darwini]